MNKFKMRVKKRLTDELARIKSFSSDFYKGEREGINFALYAIDSIDEPEKAILTSKEAEWLTRLQSEHTLEKTLWVINRAGHGFSFFFEDKLGITHYLDEELSYMELKLKLTKAAINGYEVEKEKLYTVEIPNPNGGTYLALCKDVDGKLFFDAFFSEEWKTFGKCKLTESEIKKDFDWAWQFAEEVKGE